MAQINYIVSGTVGELFSAFGRLDSEVQEAILASLGFYDRNRPIEVDFGTQEGNAENLLSTITSEQEATQGDGCWSIEVASYDESRRRDGFVYTVSGRHNRATHCTCASHDPNKGGRLVCKHMADETFRRQETERVRIANLTPARSNGTLLCDTGAPRVTTYGEAFG